MGLLLVSFLRCFRLSFSLVMWEMGKIPMFLAFSSVGKGL